MDTWILLRGLTREAAHWGAFAGDFQTALPQAKVVALDLPGNGQLHALPSPLTVQGMVAACRAELARQGVLPPFHLFAMSLGAMVATEWARTAPEEISGCVLVNTSFRPFSPFFHRLRPRNYAALLGLALRPPSADAIERTVWRLTSNAPGPRTAVIDDWVAAR
ncbi:MAG: alpha/beta fold hydrolase, partial [Acidovorax defluvii]